VRLVDVPSRGMGSIRLLVVLGALCCVVTAQAAVPRLGPYFVGANGRFVAKPTAVIDLSGTDSYEIGGSRWTRWNPTGGTARTTYYVNICKPDCARGRYTKQAATVRFYRTALCRGKVVFTNFVVTSLVGKRLLAGNFRGIGYLHNC
jgi:hypothetical protein